MDNIKHSVEDLSNFFNCYITFLEKDTLTLSSKKPEYEYGKWPYDPDSVTIRNAHLIVQDINKYTKSDRVAPTTSTLDLGNTIMQTVLTLDKYSKRFSDSIVTYFIENSYTIPVSSRIHVGYAVFIGLLFSGECHRISDNILYVKPIKRCVRMNRNIDSNSILLESRRIIHINIEWSKK